MIFNVQQKTLYRKKKKAALKCRISGPLKTNLAVLIIMPCSGKQTSLLYHPVKIVSLSLAIYVKAVILLSNGIRWKKINIKPH